MRIAEILIATLMAISTLKAQEPIIISGFVDRNNYRVTQPFSKEAASALFIQERGSIAFQYPYSTEGSVWAITLTEESAQRMGKPIIGVVFVNNAGIIHPPLLSDKEPSTLEIIPFLKSNIYFCKHYVPQGATNTYSLEMYDELERNITRFLENPVQGDTLKEPSVRVDSRYTALLIKNLTNDSKIYLQWDRTYYEPVLMSEFVRERLKEIFHSIYWSFAFPDAKAPATEWQKWFDELLKDNENEEK